LQDEKGWTWKHDVAERGGKYRAEPLADYLKEMPCRKALIYGAESVLVTPEVLEYMTGLYGPNDPIVCIPDAQHHLMLDQPLAFVDALRSILAGWDM
jgi:pimeloyl-ACP methyl ester carboxylesterase